MEIFIRRNSLFSPFATHIIIFIIFVSIASEFFSKRNFHLIVYNLLPFEVKFKRRVITEKKYIFEEAADTKV